MLREINREKTRYIRHASPYDGMNNLEKKALAIVIFPFLSGLFLVLAFPKSSLSFLAWFALVPLLYVISRLSSASSFGISYLTGLIFFVGNIYWLTYVTRLGYVILCLVLSLFFAFFGLISHLLIRGLYNSKKKSLLILGIPSLWVAFEFFRSYVLTGFPWALLGYTQYKHPIIIQIADITGAYGVSFVIVMVNVAAYLCLSAAIAGRQASAEESGYAFSRLKPSGIMLTITLLAVFLYGYFSLKKVEEPEIALRLSVVQGNIEQEKKWDPLYRQLILSTYEELTKEAAAEGTDLIIWPETSVPGFLDDEDIRYRLNRLMAETGKPLLLGAITYDFDGYNESYFNSAVHLSESGVLLDKYDKLHLVPFGEYIPFERYLPFFRRFIDVTIGDFKKGKSDIIFNIRAGADKSSRNVGFASLICFEDIFSYLARRFVNKGADFLVNITNDAWFKKSSEQMQHTQASVFRAVESRIDVIRAANTGFSCHISEKGIIKDAILSSEKGMYIEGTKTFDVGISKTGSVYSRYGDIFALLCVLSAFIICVFAIKVE